MSSYKRFKAKEMELISLVHHFVDERGYTPLHGKHVLSRSKVHLLGKDYLSDGGHCVINILMEIFYCESSKSHEFNIVVQLQFNQRKLFPKALALAPGTSNNIKINYQILSHFVKSPSNFMIFLDEFIAGGSSDYEMVEL